MNKTYSAKESEVERKWYVVDAEDMVLGRLASRVASILRGKHKPTFTPHLDVGDHVIVVNADKVVLTGTKLKNKIYYRHTGYPGKLKSIHAEKLLKEKPTWLVTYAVRGMLPKNRLGRAMFKKLKVYAGGEHPHEAQKPEELKLSDN